MKKLYIFLIVLALANFKSFAQMEEPFPPNPDQMAKIDELEKMKMIEFLDLDEATFVKFFARRKEFKESQRKIWNQRNQIAEKLEHNIKNNDGSDKANYALVEKILQLEKDGINAKADFINSLKEIMPEKEIAKFVAFEHVFRKEIRDMIFRPGRRHGAGRQFRNSP